jgi:hypothetical protein
MAKRSQLFLLPLREQKPPGIWAVVFFVWMSLYLPFVWLVVFEGPWDQRRWSWIQSWPLLPGLVVQSLEPVASTTPQVSYALMGAVSFAAFVVLFRLGRKSRPFLLLAFLLGAAYASYNSWLAFQAYPHAF